MTFTYDKFLKPLNPGEKNVIIYDDNGKIIHTVNPYSIINIFVNNNLLKISLQSDRIITLNFISSDLSKSAITLLQQRIEILKNLNPLFIDKQIEKYVGDKIVDITNVVETGDGKINYVPHWISATALSSTGSIWDDGKSVSIGLTGGSSIFNVSSPPIPSTYSIDDYYIGGYGSNKPIVDIKGNIDGISDIKSKQDIPIFPGIPSYPSGWVVDESPLVQIGGSGYGTSLMVKNNSDYVSTTSTQSGQIEIKSGPAIVTHFGGTDPLFIWETKQSPRRLRLESTLQNWEFWSESAAPGYGNIMLNYSSSSWTFSITATADAGSNTILHTSPGYSTVGYTITGPSYTTYSLVSQGTVSNILTFSSTYSIGVGMVLTGTRRNPITGAPQNLFQPNTIIDSIDPDNQTVFLSATSSLSIQTTDQIFLSGPIYPNSVISSRIGVGSVISNSLLRTMYPGEVVTMFAPSGNVGISTNVMTYKLNVGGTVSSTGIRTTSLTLLGNSASEYSLLMGDSLGNAKWVPAGQVMGQGYTGTSSTQLTIGTAGTYFSVKTQPNLSFTPGQTVVLYDQLNALYVDGNYVNGFSTNKIIAEIDSYSASSGTMSLVALYSQNVGSASNTWKINLSGTVGPQGGFASGTASISGNIVPSRDYDDPLGGFSLGTPNLRWENIYVKDALVASQSLYIGNIKLSEEGNVLQVGNVAVNKYEGSSNTDLIIGENGQFVSLITEKNLSYVQGDTVKVSNRLKSNYEEPGYSEEGVYGYFIGLVDTYFRETGELKIVITYTEDQGFRSNIWYLKLNSDMLGFEADLTNNLKGLGLVGTSSTTMTIPQINDVREFYTQLDLGFYTGQEVIVYNEFFNNYEDPEYQEGDSNYFIGRVDFYYPNTGLLTVVVDYTVGSGTFSSWQVTVSSLPGLGATGSQGGQGGTPTLNLTFSSVESFTVTHNSGVYPLIQILDDGGNYFLPTSIVHTSTSSFDLSFTTYSSGTVIVGGGAGPQGPVGPSGGITATASFTELTVTGTTILQQVVEKLNTSTQSSNIVYDFNLGSIWYHNDLTSDYNADFINVPTYSNTAISTNIIIEQSGTGYLPTTLSINGATQNVTWIGGTPSMGTANITEIVGFSFINYNGTFVDILGQVSNGLVGGGGSPGPQGFQGPQGPTGSQFNGYQYEIHVSQVDGDDTTGNGDLINPVATITKALTLLSGSRKTIIVHPGTYTENITVADTNTTIATSELTGANTLLSGTLTIGTLGSGSRISGLKMSNLVISGTAQAYISNCTVDTQVTKSSSGYVEIINTEMQCISGIQISGSNTTIINGNKNVGVSVSNASAQVIIKGCNSVVTPSASAGNLAIVDCIVTALGGNAITITGGSTVLTLGNSQVLVQAGNNVSPISVAGIYSIFNTVFDKPNSSLTGTSTNSIDYFQYINADKFITQGGSSSQFVRGDGSLGEGPVGTTGPQGETGPQGPIGFQGPTGPSISPIVGSWSLAAGGNTVSFTVTGGQSYVMWVNGNIPNGIVNWNATVTLSNTNVPAIGVQYGWYYIDGNALVLTSMPSHIVGAAGIISTASIPVSNSNTFTFGIDNNSGSSQIIYYGYTQVS
jgi:hypothetical protein